MTGDIITYDYYGSLYINLTNRCDCRCVFCIRDQADSSLGGLWLQEEPKKEDVLAEILGQDLTQYAEIVFCGYGEPTCRLDDLLWICDQLHAAHRPDLPPIRLNTNGHASLICHRDVTPELQGRLDAVSVSLNASNAADYLAITRPGAGEAAWQAMLDFVRDAQNYVPKVWTTKKHPRRSKPAATWPKASAPSSACAPSPGEKKKGRVTEKKGIRQRYPSFLSFLINLLEK